VCKVRKIPHCIKNIIDKIIPLEGVCTCNCAYSYQLVAPIYLPTKSTYTKHVHFLTVLQKLCLQTLANDRGKVEFLAVLFWTCWLYYLFCEIKHLSMNYWLPSFSFFSFAHFSVACWPFTYWFFVMNCLCVINVAITFSPSLFPPFDFIYCILCFVENFTT
jgi:hypothetical protein